MFYEFPLIEKLDDVLSAIEGRSEFVVAEREGFTVVNYIVAMDDTFPPIKTFALEHADKIDWVSKAVTFSCWDGNKNVREEVLNIVKKNLGTQIKVDNIRYLWNNHKWNNMENIE